MLECLVGRSEGFAPIGSLRGDHSGSDDLVRGADDLVRGPDDAGHAQLHAADDDGPDVLRAADADLLRGGTG